MSKYARPPSRSRSRRTAAVEMRPAAPGRRPGGGPPPTPPPAPPAHPRAPPAAHLRPETEGRAQPDSGKTRARRAGGRYRPHTVHGLGLDQKDLGPPRAAPGSGSSGGGGGGGRRRRAAGSGRQAGTERETPRRGGAGARAGGHGTDGAGAPDRPRPRAAGARTAARPQPGGSARSGGQTPRRPAGRRRGTRPRGADAPTDSASGASRPSRRGESHGGYLERGRRARGTARPTGHRPDVDHQNHRVPHTPAAARGPRRCRPVTHGGLTVHRSDRARRVPADARRPTPTRSPLPPERGRALLSPPPPTSHTPAPFPGTPPRAADDRRPAEADPVQGRRREATGEGERPPRRGAANPSRRTARETRPEDPQRAVPQAGGERKAVVAGAAGEGSPTETLLRLLLPLDSQVRPSSQRSARAVGRPRRGRSEGLTKPSNRHSDYHRKLIGQTFEWVVAATGGVRSARGYLESPKPPAPAPRPGPGGG
ncbi:basic salivary proline-rich protein 4-like [Cervus canadensis]|uniref:basic salivary proline-rich protein 4-like n=1 Tax=Cervus canadensis TaxID=1574408 RepID=UPI001C9E5C54|nr:basic salivary proline-rich protein 4-like [Cervus canadensis]